MMGLGSRASTLEHIFGFHNWRRTVSNRGILARRMAENVKEGREHREAFEALDASLRAEVPELVESWKRWVHDWESKQHVDGTESPYELKEPSKSGNKHVKLSLTSRAEYTLKQVKLAMEAEELAQTGQGDTIADEDTPSSFILTALEIEQSQ